MKIPNHNKSRNLKLKDTFSEMMWSLETYNRSIVKTTGKIDYYSIVHECKTNLVNVLKELKIIWWGTNINPYD